VAKEKITVQVSHYGDSATIVDRDIAFTRSCPLSSPASACENAARKLRAITLLLTLDQAAALRSLNDLDAEHVLHVVADLAAEVHVLAMLAEEVERPAATVKESRTSRHAQSAEVPNG
jgi:hypothetical protein